MLIKAGRFMRVDQWQDKIKCFSRDWELIFNSTHDAMLITEFVQGEVYCLVSNKAHQELTGFDLEQIKGKTLEEVLGEILGIKVKENYLRCVEQKIPITYEETLTLNKVEKVWQVTLTPVFEEGEIKYIICSRRDITLQKKQEEEIRKRLHYEQLVSCISKLALKEMERQVFLSKALEIMGKGSKVSRVYIFEQDTGKETISNTFEWTSPGTASQQGILQDLEMTDFIWWVDKITKREVINYSDIDKIPDEITRSILKRQGIKSLLVLPICTEKGKMSFIGFDECKDNREWTEHEINLLEVVAEIIYQYLRLREYEEEIIYKSYHDVLTGLYNRRFIDDKLEELDKPENLPIAVIIADVNGLKVVNDALGHKMGDVIIKEAADAIKRSCRHGDVIVRWGGDEFLLLLPKTSADTAEQIVERIHQNCRDITKIPVKLSMALGFATKTKKSQKITSVLRDAEEWMYRNKLLMEKSSRKAIVDTLLSALMEKSAETREHGERLKKWGIKIAKKLCLSMREIDEIALLALLHDIGKVGIREEVLKKPSALTDEEWEEMKKHSAIGCRIAQNTAELLSVAEYILSHHERWDGKGYPRGLKGKEIPLLSRIIAVVDAYDAMTSDRPYRKALTHGEAVAEIKNNAGIQFDPEMVEIFLEVLEEKER